MSTCVWVQPFPDYPGVYTLHVEAGDMASRVVLTQPQLEFLRASATDAMARTDRERKRRKQA